jgi:hypothetical protein
MKKIFNLLFLFASSLAFSQYIIQKPQESVNVRLVEKTLKSRQNQYDYNIQMIRNAENACSQLILSKSGEYNLDYDHFVKIRNRFNDEYRNPVRNMNYDYSNKNLTLKVIDYLFDGVTKILNEEL